MLQLDSRFIKDLVRKDLIAFGTGGIGKIVIPYLSQEPDIKLHGVTNSRVTAVDAGTFLDTRLPIRSLDTWVKLLPDATVLLCVTPDNEDTCYESCKRAGFHNILPFPLDLVEALQICYNPSRLPTSSPLLEVACLANELHDIHRAAFLEFKGCNKGRTVVAVATGPTLNYYVQVKGIPHIGTNSCVLKKELHLDYYFLWHYIDQWRNELKNCDCVKFFARNEKYPNTHFPECVVEENHARRFFSSEPSKDIYTDIEYHPLMGFRSIIFQALHFAIYTRPKRILLVGCDCSMDGYYDGSPTINNPVSRSLRSIWLEGYTIFKQFVNEYYPDTEIISVNPVGLRGMFHDVYTESYLEAHPELDRSACEMFDAKKFEE